KWMPSRKWKKHYFGPASGLCAIHLLFLVSNMHTCQTDESSMKECFIHGTNLLLKDHQGYMADKSLKWRCLLCQPASIGQTLPT
ncbi:Hypothetical predicted protein, partial [Podarcis lilfordi]